jgi:hypothetical protein
MTGRRNNKLWSSRKNLSTTAPEWEFLVSRVSGERVSLIKSQDGLYSNLDPKYDYIPGVYTHYLSSEINSEHMHNKWNAGWNTPNDYIIMFHPDLLRDRKFTVCKSMMYGRCIDKYNTDRKNLQLMDSPGSLESRPDMSELVKWINKVLDPKQYSNEKLPVINSYQTDFGYTPNKIKTMFPWTHEVIFNMIPTKYILAVFTYDNNAVESLQSYFPDKIVLHINAPSNSDEHYYKDYILPLLQKLYTVVINEPIKRVSTEAEEYNKYFMTPTRDEINLEYKALGHRV